MELKLLIVDDEPAVLKLIKTQVETLGYEVLTIADSRQAVQRVNREKFDGIFVDARMPYVDGVELIKHIRTSPSNREAPIVMLAGSDDVESMRAGFKAGITFFLTKPLNIDKLRQLLKATRGAMLGEKRRHARLPLRTVVNCRGEKNQFKSVSLNIGQGGMLLEASGDAEVGQELELRFTLPQMPELLNPRAIVVRKEPPDRIGVQFLDLRPEDRKAIEAFVAGLVRE